MGNNKEKTKRKCAFYVSEYHCNLIISKYLNENIDKEIILFTQNNQKDKIVKLVEVLNFDEESKENLLKQNWNSFSEMNFSKINKNINENKATTIFIQGNEEYIKNINRNI